MEATAQPPISSSNNHNAPITSQTEGARDGATASGSSTEASAQGSSRGSALRNATTARSISAKSRAS